MNNNTQTKSRTRILTETEWLRRGCEYCLSSRPQHRCRLDQCPHHELDNVLDYDDYYHGRGIHTEDTIVESIMRGLHDQWLRDGIATMYIHDSMLSDYLHGVRMAAFQGGVPLAIVDDLSLQHMIGHFIWKDNTPGIVARLAQSCEKEALANGKLVLRITHDYCAGTAERPLVAGLTPAQAPANTWAPGLSTAQPVDLNRIARAWRSRSHRPLCWLLGTTRLLPEYLPMNQLLATATVASRQRERSLV